MTPIADMVARMIAAGVSADMIELAVATAETTARPSVSMDTSADTVLSLKRQADRERKKIERIQAKTGKQTMSGADETVHGQSKENGLPACNLLPVLSSTEVLESKKVVVEKQARARGTRLSTDSKISTENRHFAAASGIPEGEIDRVWSEFIDYWIAVPGARGTKLNWDATWRNRVRTLTPWKGAKNGAKPDGLAAAADRFIADAREREEPADDGFLDLRVESR